MSMATVQTNQEQQHKDKKRKKVSGKVFRFADYHCLLNSTHAESTIRKEKTLVCTTASKNVNFWGKTEQQEFKRLFIS